MPTFRAILKIIFFSVFTIFMVCLQIIIMGFTRGPKAYIVPYYWQKGVCRIFQIKVVTVGQPETRKQTFFLVNHVSYLDIPALGSILKASFVAKSEVETWPLFGFLSKLQQTVFIGRDKSKAAQGKTALNKSLDEKKSLILFPEGTSSEGYTVLPFKSSMFSIAYSEEAQNICIQPVTLCIEEVNKKAPQTQSERDIYAWHLNMDTPLPQHLWLFAKSNGAKIRLIFHPAFEKNNYEDRKKLSNACHETVLKGFTSKMPITLEG